MIGATWNFQRMMCMEKFGDRCEKHFPKKFTPYTKVNEKEIYSFLSYPASQGKGMSPCLSFERMKTP